MAAHAPTKKLRKAYTITKIMRDRWTHDEHNRFLNALLLFGHDWKKVEEFVGTKTVIEICSHAQKYFLKVQKNGMMAYVPPPRLKRKATYLHQQKPPGNDKISLEASRIFSPESTCLVPASTVQGDTSMVTNYSSNEAILSLDYLSAVHVVGGKSCSGDEVQERGNPHSLNSVAPNMAEIYRLFGDIFNPDIKYPLWAYMQKLKEMDPITVKTVLLMVRNLIENLSSPNFELHERTLSTYGANTKIIMASTEDAAPVEKMNIMPPC